MKTGESTTKRLEKELEYQLRHRKELREAIITATSPEERCVYWNLLDASDIVTLKLFNRLKK